MIDSATSDAGPTSFAPEEGRVERARSSEAPHPLGLAPAPQGKLDVPPGAYMHVGPPLPANALGTAEWLPDDAADNCMRCGEEFSFFTRKHHCRQCGQIFCHRCCNSRALLQGAWARQLHEDPCGHCSEPLLTVGHWFESRSNDSELRHSVRRAC